MKNLTLLTLNNTLHIKADNLEPIEVDSSCVDEFMFYIGNIIQKEDLIKGINISELSYRIEVRYITRWIEHETDPYPIAIRRAFLLPSKEVDDSINFVLDNQKELEVCLDIVDKKSYTIEEIERAFEPINKILKIGVMNELFKNLKK